MRHIHTYKELLLGHEKDEILPFMTMIMSIMLSEINQTKKGQELRFHSQVGYQTTKSNKTKQTHSHGQHYGSYLSGK